MKLLALLFLALVATSYADQALFKGLAKMNKDPTGAAILSAISMNLKAKTPLTDIGDLLQSLLNSQLADSQQFQSGLDDTIARLTSAISDGQALSQNFQSAISTLQSTIDTSSSSLTDDQTQLTNDQQALVTEQQTVVDRDAAAQVDLPAFDADLSDLANAIQAINEALGKMRIFQQSNENTASFLQMSTGVKDKLRKVTDTISGMRKKLAKHSNMFTPLTIELIDLTSGLSQAKSDQVIDLLTQLLNLLSSIKAHTETNRATYAENYQNSQAQSNAKISGLQASIQQLQQNIASLTDKIGQAQQSLAQFQENLASNNANIASNQDALKTAQSKLETGRARYENLIALIRQAISYFNQNLSQVDDYVSSVVNASL